MINCLNSEVTDSFASYQGDCVDVLKQLPDNSVDHCIHSPPFANLYCYSSSERDMGNCVDDKQFMVHYGFAVAELHRVLRPGRLVAVHCKDLVNYAGRDGMAGLRDFPGEIIRLFTAHGFAWHSKTTIWKDPVVEMQRTKAHGLLYKQLRTDSTFSRMGLPEYVLFFRKWATEAQADKIAAVGHTEQDFPLSQWQRWASPVWMDIVQTNVLNVKAAREDRDEKHMCPLQLDVIERCLVLYSNPGDVVLSPFAGIGSEGFVALRMGRRFVGIELKESYWKMGLRNLHEAVEKKGSQGDLFAGFVAR